MLFWYQIVTKTLRKMYLAQIHTYNKSFTARIGLNYQKFVNLNGLSYANRLDFGQKSVFYKFR